MPRQSGSSRLLLRLIVIKKVVLALILLLVSLAALVGSRQFDQLSRWRLAIFSMNKAPEPCWSWGSPCWACC